MTITITMTTVDINYWAVLVAAIASMVIGFLWYGVLFGKIWTRMMGWDPNDTARMEAMKKEANKGYTLQFIGSLVMAYVLAHALVFASAYSNTTGFNAGLMVGFWNWLGFIAPVTLGSVLWEGKSWNLWVLNNGHNLLSLVVMGVILAVWK